MDEHPDLDCTIHMDYVHVWDIAQAHVVAVEQFGRTLDRVAAFANVQGLGYP